jgi:poly(3-hydroxybutyrate) depolymerase
MSRALAGLVAALAIAASPVAAVAADPSDPGKTETFTYDSGGTAYPYIVYTPTTYHAAHPAPMIVMTHGCQTTAEQQMRANLYNPLAEREGIVMLYPDVDAMEVSQPGPTARYGYFLHRLFEIELALREDW